MAEDRKKPWDKFSIEEFDGVDNAVSELNLEDGAVPWLYGGYATEQNAIRRIPGKLLHSSVTTGGQVITISQMDFSDQTVVFLHRGSNYLVEDDITPLIAEPGDVIDPLEPFIF